MGSEHAMVLTHKTKQKMCGDMNVDEGVNEDGLDQESAQTCRFGRCSDLCGGRGTAQKKSNIFLRHECKAVAVLFPIGVHDLSPTPASAAYRPHQLI